MDKNTCYFNCLTRLFTLLYCTELYTKIFKFWWELSSIQQQIPQIKSLKNIDLEVLQIIFYFILQTESNLNKFCTWRPIGKI